MKTKQTLNVKILVFLHLILFFGFGNLYSQAQLPGWCVAPNSINFVAPPIPPPPSVSSLNSSDYIDESPTFLTNSIADASGNPIFFVVDGNIYDIGGYRIDNFKEAGVLLNDFSQEISIVPVPGSCTSYYLIFGVRANLLGGGGITYYPVYSILDMSAQNINYPLDPTKRGALQYSVPGATNITNLGVLTPYPSIFTEYSSHLTNHFGIAVTPFRIATSDHLMFIHGDRGMISLTINSTGITFLTAPFGLFSGDPIGFQPPTGGQNNTNYTEMEVVLLSTGNYRVGKALGNRYVCVADFSPVTSLLIAGTEKYIALPSSVSSSDNTEIVGLEFSKDGKKIYYSTTSPSILTSPIGFADLNLASPVPTPMNFTGVANLDACQIEMGNDNKMYFNGGTQLYVLNNPNAIPTAVNWSASVALAGAFSGSVFSKLLPDQMDGNIYSGGTAGTFISSYTAGTFPYTALTQTWTPTSNPFGGTTGSPVGTVTNPITVLSELVIPAGYTITIQGMTFKFKARTKTFPSGIPTINYGARVVVKSSTIIGSKGGRLNLKNLGTIPTVFTNDNFCTNGMWEGVEVWGNNAQAQIPTSTCVQGLLSMTNSTIENAYYGAFAGKKNAAYNFYLPNTQGGIIQATGSTFRNNWNDAWFNPYNFANSISFFRYTLFITDAPLNETTTTALYANPAYHIYMNDTKNISFKTCTFKNNFPTSLYPVLTTSGTGIYSRNTQFFCLPAITSFSGIGTACTFENLRYGIYALNTITKTVTADQNIFKNCWRGTFLSNITTATFTRNKYFIYEQISGTPTPQAAYGLYLDYCTGFKVTENRFYYNTHNESLLNDVASSFNDFGCIVNQSNSKRICAKDGYGGDELYKNYFNEMFVGAQSQGDNSEKAYNPSAGFNPCYLTPGTTTTPNNVGLRFLCNDLKGVDKNDIRITDFSSGGVSGGGLPVLGNVSFQQGFTGVPAGNSFSHSQCPASTILSDNEIFEDATPNNTTNPNFFDYVYHNVDETIYGTKPYCYSPLNLPLYTGVNAIGIPSSYSTAGTCTTKVSTGAVPMSKAQIALSKSNINVLNLLLEEGDAQSMINLIATGSNGAILSGLLAESPYLSDRIIIAALNKGLPPGIIEQIIIANSPLSVEVKAVLDAINLPNGIRNQINAAQTGGKSGRDLVVEQIGYNYSQKGYYSNEIVRFFLNDTLNDNGLDSIIQLAEAGVISLPDNSCTVVKSYLSKGDTTMALQKANDIQAVQGVNGECAYLFTLIKLESAYDNYEATTRDVSLKVELEAIASDVKMEDYSSANAILKFIFNNPYEEWIEPFHAPMHSMQQFAEQNSILSDTKESYLTMYPNPANDVVYFDYQLPEKITQATVNVYNYAGMLVHSFTIYGSEGTATQNVEGLSNGLYMFSIISNNTSIAQQKVVISK